MTQLKKLDGISRKDIVGLPVKHLRFNDGNIRYRYGFNRNHESRVLELVKSQIGVLSGEDSTLSDEDFQFIIDNLSDPDDGTTEKRMDVLILSVESMGVREIIRGMWNSASDTFTVTGGNRRLASLIIIELKRQRGLTSAKIERVFVLHEDGQNELEVLYRQATENSGRAYEPIEQGELFKSLLDMGATKTEIANRCCGGSLQIVESRLALVGLPVTIKDEVKAGNIKPTVAVSIIKEEIEAGTPKEVVIEGIKEAVKTVKEQGKGKADKSTVKAAIDKVAKTKDVPQSPSSQVKREGLVKAFRETSDQFFDYSEMSNLINELSADELNEIVSSLKKFNKLFKSKFK